MQIIEKYFPELIANDTQRQQLEQLEALYRSWNERINVISRKDIDSLYERHVLHALALYKYQSFPEGCVLLDIGTGGGFPAIPLAIALPHVHVFAIDSIGKKIQVVNAIKETLNLHNLTARQQRAENFNQPVDFIVSRAVAPIKQLVTWTEPYLKLIGKQGIRGKYLLLKGGDLSEEIADFLDGNRKFSVKETNLSDYFEEEFFETKKIVELGR